MNKTSTTNMYRLFFIGSLFMIVLFASCTTKQMVVSSEAFYESLYEMEESIVSLESDYQPSGYGSETINEVVVTGTTSNDYGGYDTHMDNDPVTYSRYAYRNAMGQNIDILIKYKIRNDYRGNPYLQLVEVAECSCQEREIFALVCGQDGIVNSVTQLIPDQQSVFYDYWRTTTLTVIGTGILAVLSYFTISNLHQPAL